MKHWSITNQYETKVNIPKYLVKVTNILYVWQDKRVTRLWSDRILYAIDGTRKFGKSF